jgi:hypothetical protein
MARHRRGSRTPSAASELPEDELTAISGELQQRMPSTPSDRVDAAVRDALEVFPGWTPHPVICPRSSAGVPKSRWISLNRRLKSNDTRHTQDHVLVPRCNHACLAS